MLKVKSKKPKSRSKTSRKFFLNLKKWFSRLSWLQKIGVGFLVFIILLIGGMYAISQWYKFSVRNQPLVVGATFTSDYAKYMGVDPKETMQAMIDELGIRNFRLVSYWDKIEENQGIYDFTDLDWQFQKARGSGSKVSLSIGLRQPRWPECHMPAWAKDTPMTTWEPQLMEFMRVVIERYKDDPALESYQLENEFFLDVFGECPDFSRERLVREYNYVKSLDSVTPVIVSRSNNAIGFPMNDPKPDKYAVSVYKRVWDKTLTHRYVEYPFPAWFYGFLAGGSKLIDGREMIIHELQTEAWLPDNKGYKMNNIKDIPEQNKSLNANRLKDRIRYGEASGVKQMDVWGAEWWYWRKVKAGDSSLWDTARQEISRINDQNADKLGY